MMKIRTKMITMGKVNSYIILATTTTTIDSCNRLNRRAGAAGGCATTTTTTTTSRTTTTTTSTRTITTTSGGMPTIAIVPGTDSQNLKLQIFVGTQTPSSPQFHSISELETQSPYAGYRSGDSVFVQSTSNLGGGNRVWSDGYTVQSPSDPINGVVITEVYVNPSFYLKHLAGHPSIVSFLGEQQ